MARPCPLPLGLPTLVLPRLRVDDLSAVSGVAVVGTPSPTALVGFAHALQRQLGVPIPGIAIMMHEFSLHDGFPKLPVDTADAVKKGTAGAPILEQMRARMVCSLLLAVDADMMALAGLAQRAGQALRRMRLAGGTITEAGLPGPDGDLGPAAIACASETEFGQVLRSLPPGSFLRDRTDLLPPPGGGDALDAVLDALVLRTKDARKSWHRNQPGWIVPLQRGYRAISATAMRPGMRGGDGVTGHVWAEEVIGLGEWVTRRRAWGENLTGLFWRHTADPARGLYLATAI